MISEVLNIVGMRCPLPILRLTLEAVDLKSGDTLEVLGDCPTFERDMRTWCERMGKVFLSLKDEGQKKKRIQIQF